MKIRYLNGANQAILSFKRVIAKTHEWKGITCFLPVYFACVDVSKLSVSLAQLAHYCRQPPISWDWIGVGLKHV